MRPENVAMSDLLPWVAAQMAWFQAALLGAAAAHKLIRWPQTKSVARRFAHIPGSLTAAAGAAAVGIELAAAALLVFPATRAAGAATAALLWFWYLLLMLAAIRAGRRDIDCGCSFGTGAAAGHRTLGVFQVTRNAVLVMLALSIAAVSWQGGIAAPPSQVLAAFSFLALYAALDQVMSLQPLRSGEVL